MPSITLPNGFKPRPYQADAMRHFDNGGRFGVYCWPRRSGKDLTFVHQTVKAAHERPGMYFHLLPTHRQARKVIWDALDNEGRRIIDTAIPMPLRESTNETEMKIKLKCGSLWQLVGADYYDSLVGSNPVGLVISEAALTDPRAWSFFRPIIAGNSGWVAFVSTPRGYNWFHDLLETAKRGHGWHWSHLDCYATKHISEDILEAERREMPDELYRQEYLTSFSAANVGAIFGRYIEQMEAEGRIRDTSFGDGETWVTSDIGFRDKAAFIFFRRSRGGFEVTGYDEGTGLDAEEWIDRLKARGEQIDVMVLPHDARAKTFQSRHSVAEQFLKGAVAKEVRVNPVRKKQDSINAGRMLLKTLVISDSEECAPLLQALRAYSFEYNEETRTFSSNPSHDWSSHAADALQEAGAVLTTLETPAREQKIIVPPIDRSFTLEQLFETVGPRGDDGRI